MPALSDSDVRAGAHGDAHIGSRQAGASLMPSPAMAQCGQRREVFGFPDIFLRRNLGVDLIDIQLFGNSLGSGVVVTGKDNNFQADAMQFRDGFPGTLLDGIG